MDHEVARILATFGIDCNTDPAIQYHEELYYWKNADRKDLQVVDWKSISSSGWRVTYLKAPGGYLNRGAYTRITQS